MFNVRLHSHVVL